MDFLIATHNKKKQAEMQRVLEPLGINVKTAAELGIELSEVEENGTTFHENARIKALSGCKESGLPCIADDSGICVDHLGGGPGIYSARYSGGDDEDNNDKLLMELEGVEKEKRTAHYACSISCCFPDGREITAEGKCYGYIGFERQGTGGFGYDPLFITEKGCFGELSPAEKDEMSHRGIALRELKEKLESENLYDK
ncbi:MAG: RdgB/HAM1 family non-canonical purine NTP pyrophosphatase [Ruminococcaceae bacterium]|nr:RdgB/HAM1 family non-canonical purine NTP pyrophosphatase [Oscillospiraceae bacterium]